MKHKSVYVILVATCFSLLGCNYAIVGGTRYYPKELEYSAPEEVIRFGVGIYAAREVQVDQIDINTLHTSVFAPGMHTVTFSVYEKTREWADIIRDMESKGFTLLPDGETFSRLEIGGDVTTARPINIKRYEWVTKSLRFCTEPGKFYGLIQKDEVFAVHSDGLSAEC